MKYVVIDLEMNPIASVYMAERAICKLEVIEIGAILLDEAYQEIGSFVTLVKPYFNSRIEKRYEKLTGIKTFMVVSIPIEISILFGNSEHPFPERKNMPFRSRVQPFI